jgi:hypothetical protein
VVSLSEDGAYLVSNALVDEEMSREQARPAAPDLFLDGRALSPALSLNLPLCRVCVAQSLVLICHKIGDGTETPIVPVLESDSDPDAGALSSKTPRPCQGIFSLKRSHLLAAFITVSFYVIARGGPLSSRSSL